MSGPVAALLGDGRLHLQHGPIDLIVGADGERGEVRRAYRQIAAAFDSVLEKLVEELAVLRAPVGDFYPPVAGPVARRMAAAVWPHRTKFITPMAAVAGAVADEMLAAMTAGRDLTRAYVNDGGDIAIHLAPGQTFRVGVAGAAGLDGDPSGEIDGFAAIPFAFPARGVATSGRGGRSLSLGIADAATVLARDAAAADAAATLIANAVDVASDAIRRLPANQVKDDSDLGAIPVTVAVGRLSEDEIATALDNGAAEARRMIAGGLILGALLQLRGRRRAVGGAWIALAAAAE
ncbi:MAG: UPF0280 family protein [Rhodospirillales bacterium]